SDFELSVDFRLISATNRNLKEKVANQTFREDLLYRISDVQLRLPSLRDRSEDIPLLARHFANPKQLSQESIDLLSSIKEWPGNVRQLKKVVESACRLTEGYLISRSTIQKQLDYQELGAAQAQIHISRHPEENLKFSDLKQMWHDGGIQGE